jgi:CPA1 family monovalent cation:H+ antiporter
MEIRIDRVELLLLIAAVVAILSRRLRFPYTVGLVITGALLGFLPIVPPMRMTKELLFSALLPPLIFEAALVLPWSKLRKEMPVVILMATVGLTLAALVTAVGLHWLVGWPPVAAGIFAVSIGATDPVSVIATFKEIRVPERLRLIVEAESLFNDGTAAVLFALLVAVAQGASTTPLGFVGNALWIVAGGIACGGLLARAVLYLAGKTTDHLVEITLTTASAYGSFLLAEQIHCSGVLATLTAGLVVGNFGALQAISERGREAAEAFWEYVAFVANSLIFLLIGLNEPLQDFSTVWAVALVAIALVTLGRAVAVYPLSGLFSRGSLRISGSYQHIMFWGGLRGALALALAQALPSALPYRRQIVTVTFAVVAFSVIVQGLTIPLLLRRLNLSPSSEDPGGPLAKEDS